MKAKAMGIALPATVVWLLVFGGQLAEGQNALQPEERITEVEDLPQVEEWVFDLVRTDTSRPRARLVQSDQVTAGNMHIDADEIHYDVGTGVFRIEGNVVVTTIRADGSTVVMRAERMTIEEGQ